MFYLVSSLLLKEKSYESQHVVMCEMYNLFFKFVNSTCFWSIWHPLSHSRIIHVWYLLGCQWLASVSNILNILVEGGDLECAAGLASDIDTFFPPWETLTIWIHLNRNESKLLFPFNVYTGTFHAYMQWVFDISQSFGWSIFKCYCPFKQCSSHCVLEPFTVFNSTSATTQSDAVLRIWLNLADRKI